MQSFIRGVYTLLTIFFCVFSAGRYGAYGASVCTITIMPTEANVRTADTARIRIVISSPASLASLPPNAAAGIALTSTSGQIVANSVAFVTDQTPQFVQINLVPNSDYDIYLPDNVTFSLPGAFFTDNSITCPDMKFSIKPSPGIISLDTLPLAITEVDINQNGVFFPLRISHDHFMNANVNWTVDRVEPGFHLVFSLRGQAPSQILDVEIKKNETFNIPRYAEIQVVITFPKEMIRSGVEPIIGAEVLGFTSINLVIQGSKPYISTEYSGDGTGILAENMWDGTANVTLRLLGDEWNLTMVDHWYNMTFGPHFEVSSRPVQPYGFTSFLTAGKWPTAVVTSRTIVLTFAASVGFALQTLSAETVDVSNLEVMMAEEMDTPCPGGCGGEYCFCANFRFLKADPSSIEVRYISPVFANTTTESSVRRNGVNITVDLHYDIFNALAVTETNVLSFFKRQPGGFTLDGMTYRLAVANTQLHIVVPPQKHYNVAENSDDVVGLVYPRVVSGTLGSSTAQLTYRQSSAGFRIRSVVTPICRMQNPRITEADIRAGDTFLNISISGDSFCLDNPTGSPLTSPLVTLFLSGIRNRGVTFFLDAYTSQTLRLGLQRDWYYDIASQVMVAIPVPADIMCSLETCRAEPAPLDSELPNSLTFPIRPVAGTIFAEFPTINETYLRETDLTVDIELLGETFSQSVFTPTWAVQTRDPVRGFKGTIQPSCDGIRHATNLSRATVKCRRSIRYDISANETARIGLDIKSVAVGMSSFSPDVDYTPLSDKVIPLRVTPVVGDVIADEMYRNISLTEEELINGGTQIVISLRYERFNQSTLSAALVDSIRVDGVSDPLGIIRSAPDIFNSKGFRFNADEDILILTLQPAPNYDIVANESFTFNISSMAVASSLTPRFNVFRVHVRPSPGRFEIYGSASHASARQVLEEELVLNIRLYNDLWIRNAEFVIRDLCPLEKLGPDEVPSCVVYVDDSNRVLTILFQPSERFTLYTNTTYTVPVEKLYIRSNIIPPQPVTMFIYVSAGRITWSGPSVVTEDTVRSGGMPAITLRVGGDALADVRAVRASLVASVTCIGSSDKYGFCGRAEYLFGDGLTLIGDSRRQLQIRLQSNEDFDVYEVQNVTLRLSGEGLVSRFSPNANESFTFQIIPTTGKFFISGFTDSITERDISGVTRKTLQMVLTLYGERWLSNKSRLVPLLATGMASDAAAHETNGFMRYRNQIITSEGTTISDSGRVMTIQFNAVPDFDIYFDERVSITISQECVLSGMRPVLSSSSNSFVIQATGGLITMTPTETTAFVMRTKGVLLTLSVDGDQWKTEVVQNPASILEAIRVGSSPQQEPSGFAVNLDVAVGDIRTRGSSINGTSLIITLLPMPLYSLVSAETITLFLKQGWTTSGFPLVPNEFTLTATPVYDFIEVVLDMRPFLLFNAAGERQNGTSFDEAAWIAKVAVALSVSSAAIEIDYSGPEYLLPSGADSALYHRIRFRVKTEDETSKAPFDNRAAANFISYQESFLRDRFSVLKAFFNNTPPAEEFWASLKPAEEKDGAFFIPINRNIVWVFASIIVIVVASVGGYMYYRTNKMLGGVSRAKEVDKASTRKAAMAEDEANEGKKFDRSVYSGQIASTYRANGDENGVPLLDAVARESSPLEVSPTGFHHEYELPMDLYSGQSPVGKQLGEATKGPALVVPEPPPLPFEDVEKMELELTAVYPRYTRPSQMFASKKSRRSAHAQ